MPLPTSTPLFLWLNLIGNQPVSADVIALEGWTEVGDFIFSVNENKVLAEKADGERVTSLVESQEAGGGGSWAEQEAGCWAVLRIQLRLETKHEQCVSISQDRKQFYATSYFWGVWWLGYFTDMMRLRCTVLMMALKLLRIYLVLFWAFSYCLDECHQGFRTWNWASASEMVEALRLAC